MGAWDHKVIATLLLSVLSFVLMMAVVMVFLIKRWRHRHKELSESASHNPEKKPGTPSSFKFHHSLLKGPNCWLAVRNRNLMTVQSAMALHNPKRCSWAEGLLGDIEAKVFLSPPVSGWILVIGSALPDASDDVDGCFRFLMDLSRKVGHVQFFSTNVMLNHHAWVQAESGHILRAYTWAGKTLWNQGKMTQAEQDVGMRCYDYLETSEGLPFAAAEPGASNSDKVHLLAARWSLDPDEIDDRFIEQEWGIVGEPSRRF